MAVIRSMGVDFIALMFLGNIERCKVKLFALHSQVFAPKSEQFGNADAFIDTSMDKISYLRTVNV